MSLRIAILGAGALGRNWSKVVSAHPEAELAAFIDPLVGSGNEAPWLATDYPTQPKARSLAELGDVDLDAAIVTAQSPAHAEAIEAALEHGLHVVVEKPFTTTLGDAERLVALAKSRGLTLMVSQNYRFFPGVAQLRTLIAEHTFGQIVSVVGSFSYDWAGKPYQHAMTHVMGLEMAVHHFDLVRAIFDAEPRKGRVVEWNTASSQYRGGGGLEALFEMDGLHGRFPFLYSGNLLGKSPNDEWAGRWRFEFDGASLVADTIDGRYGLYRLDGETSTWLGPFSSEVGFTHSFAHFADAIRSGSTPWSSGEDNLGTLRMALGFFDEASA